MKRNTIILTAVCLVALGAGGWYAYLRAYARPKADLLAQIRDYEEGLAEREAELRRAAGIRDRLRRLAATTLGSDEEAVSAALRSVANEILASQRLTDTRVSTSRPEGLRNPAVARVSEFANDRAARTTPDFFVMSATVRGIGGLEQVLRTMATFQAQPWVHRLESWTITPMDRDRTRFELSVEFSSIYFAERELRPREAADGRRWEPLSETRFAPYRAILAQAAFREPPPPARQQPRQEVAAAAPPPAPASPPPPPYGDWRVTAVVSGQSGTELWLQNTKSGQRTTLEPGQALLDAVFVDAAGETATVEIDGTPFLVKLGQTLADRLAVMR